MNIQKIIAELQGEKERLDEAIRVLERLSAGEVKRQVSPVRAAHRETEEPKSDEGQNRTREQAAGKP
jgi:hypothetical protein